MSNRPARITQAEIERAIRAAKKAGLTEVEVRLGDEASIRIPLAPKKPIADAGEIILLCKTCLAHAPRTCIVR
jgi:2-iminoacetate synthase ThiH